MFIFTLLTVDVSVVGSFLFPPPVLSFPSWALPLLRAQCGRPTIDGLTLTLFPSKNFNQLPRNPSVLARIRIKPSSSSKMPRCFASLFSRKKSQTLAFKDYYTNWFNILQKTLLPLIHQSLSSSSSQTLLYSHVDLLLRHFLSYYDALDSAATQENLPDLLFPSWRNSLEVPFLFLGDLHPYLFTNLLRSFLDEESEEEEEEDGHDDSFDNRPWQVFMAWRNVSKNLMSRIEQIECGMRLMVPALMGRIKKVQSGFVGRIAEDRVAFEEQSDEGLKGVIGEAMKEEMDDMVSVFVDANRLRKSVIAEIVGALSVYQAALFLEGLAQFLVGLRDREVLSEFNRCKIPIG